jgi:Ca2+-binding RTX toxin-like protein
VVFGGDGADTILGADAAADQIFGGAGNDFIRAFSTDPEAATASDELFGGGDDDTLLGGNAADRLDGGPGDDFLQGFGGADTFSFRAGEAGDDTIADFSPGTDIVELNGFAATFDPLANLSDVGNGAVLDLGGGNSVLFIGRFTAEFDAGDFLLL